MATVREQWEAELEQMRRVQSKYGANVPKYYPMSIARYEDDLAWFETDEIRPCWTVTGIWETPLIFTQDGEWDDWVDDLDDEFKPDVTVTEGTISGRDAGDLHYCEM